MTIKLERERVDRWKFDMMIKRERSESGLQTVVWQQAVPSYNYEDDITEYRGLKTADVREASIVPYMRQGLTLAVVVAVIWVPVHFTATPAPRGQWVTHNEWWWVVAALLVVLWLLRKPWSRFLDGVLPIPAKPPRLAEEMTVKILEYKGNEFYVIPCGITLVNDNGKLVLYRTLPFVFKMMQEKDYQVIPLKRVQGFVLEKREDSTFKDHENRTQTVAAGDLIHLDLGEGEIILAAHSWRSGNQMNRLRAELHRAFITERPGAVDPELYPHGLSGRGDEEDVI